VNTFVPDLLVLNRFRNRPSNFRTAHGKLSSLSFWQMQKKQQQRLQQMKKINAKETTRLQICLQQTHAGNIIL